MNQRPEDLAAIASQVAQLERQLLAVRSQLTPLTESLPTEAFSALRVRVGDAWYAIATSSIREVIPIVASQSIPEAPFWALGTFRYRGRTLVAIDLHRRLYQKETPLHSSMVLVVSKAPHEVGLVAEAVGNLFIVQPETIEPPTSGIPQSPFLAGTIPDTEGRVMHLLSLPRVAQDSLFEAELAASHTDADTAPPSPGAEEAAPQV